MQTRVLITIDTELTWRHHEAGFGWEDNYTRSVEPAGVGLSYQLAKLAEHGLKACFFVDPMPTVLFGPDPVKRMVETVLDAGQEVQLHLHPMWEGARLDGSKDPAVPFELIDHDLEAQVALIAKARDLLVSAGAPDPIAFRSGSYAANADTLAALARLGIAYDSSHNGCEAPWPSALALPLEQIAPVKLGGVIEIPVSQVLMPRGGFRHLQICAVSIGEMRTALRHAVAKQLPVVTIVGHSFELATRNGLYPNSIVKARFDRLCALLAQRRDTGPTVHFADLADVPLGGSGDPAGVSHFAVAQRMAQQLLSNVIDRLAA